MFGTVVFLLSSFWLLPLSVVTAAVGLPEAGLAARTIDGTAWKGRMLDTSFMGTNMGNVQVRMSPLGLLGGAARFRLDGTGTSGEGYFGIGARGLRNVDATLTPGGALRNMKIDTVRLTGLSVGYAGKGCAEASGQMTAHLASGPLSRATGPQLSGPASCSNGTLSFRLTDTGGKAVFSLEYPSGATPRFTFLLTPAAALDKPMLSALGFVETPVGFRKTGQLTD